MGNGYGVPVTQWSKGEYPNSNNVEDDLAKIPTFIPFIADDYGNTAALAAAITSGTTVRGRISNVADTDFFKFNARVGLLTVNVQLVPDWVKEVNWVVSTGRSNLDVKLQLINTANTVLSTGDTLTLNAYSGTNLPASISYTIATAGTYYLSVKGTGYATATTGGYSAYGSIGSYALKATFTPQAAAAGRKMLL